MHQLPPSSTNSSKQGLSGLKTCDDARALRLDLSWHYNWGWWPASRDAGGGERPAGSRICDPPIAREFVPMVWGCWGNCTYWAWPTIRDDWASVGVTHLLGFNEPDNTGQSNLSPAQAAAYWPQLDALAASFDPPLTLVGPGMTHWDETGGSEWLDHFLGNLSADLRGRIAFLAQHDYSGDAVGIVARAEAAFAKYGRRVWLTEYAVGKTANRPANDAFMNASLPLLLASDAVARFAWCVRCGAVRKKKEHAKARRRSVPAWDPTPAPPMGCLTVTANHDHPAPHRFMQVRRAQPRRRWLGERVQLAAAAAAAPFSAAALGRVAQHDLCRGGGAPALGVVASDLTVPAATCTCGGARWG